MIELKRMNVVKIVESEHQAQKWERKGFERVESHDVSVDSPKNDDPKPLEKMTVTELETYAAENGIDLTDCKNKEEKLERIISVEGGN